MKKLFKKISAVIMAFTILGVGTTISKTILPEKTKIMTAQASKWFRVDYVGNYRYIYYYSSHLVEVYKGSRGNWTLIGTYYA
ncbi:MAG: hypothetical protein K6G33_03790 [Ruminococcus sp.]|uniref:hypothetical protein n=1 Tax=Ruminococcus sp. TaxID=41978 RepID=UPI0025DB07AA|nr:hypothetical protein [Ruminococcus sp.]MCR5599853.1 hypothetical protein [Ruminococcus sp.]